MTFAIGIYNYKTPANVGMLFRSAYVFGANKLFTIGRRYEECAADTPKSTRHIEYVHFDSVQEFLDATDGKNVVSIEMTDRADYLGGYVHPDNAWYVLGNEVTGVPDEILDVSDNVIIQTAKPYSLNVAVAGSIVMSNRFAEELF